MADLSTNDQLDDHHSPWQQHYHYSPFTIEAVRAAAKAFHGAYLAAKFEPFGDSSIGLVQLEDDMTRSKCNECVCVYADKKQRWRPPYITVVALRLLQLQLTKSKQSLE